MARRISLLLIFTLLFATSAFAAQATVAQQAEQIKQAIRAQHANWRADANTFTAQLSNEEFAAMLGVDQSRPNQIRDVWRPSGNRSLPAHYDWRDISGDSYVTPIRYQGRCGSCVAFASVGAVESGILIRDNTPNMDIDLSEQQAFNCSWFAGCDYGSTAGDVLSTIKSNGVVDEDCFPYMSGGTVYDYDCADACDDAANRSFQIAGYQSIWGGVNAIKQAIMDHGPVLASFTVYEDLKFYVDGVYRHVWGSYLGGHEVLLIGWDDADQAWIVKNSWSEKFGEDGFFRIYWYACGISGDTVKVDIGTDTFTPGDPPGGDCTAAGTHLYDTCGLAYDLADETLSEDGFVAACEAGDLPQCVHSCHEQHSDCNLLATCIGFCTDQWCDMGLTYMYDSCGLGVELTAGEPLSKEDAIALCDEVGYASAAMKCELECVARSTDCDSLETCQADCTLCPFPTVDFSVDTTGGENAPLTVTFTRNVTIPANCAPNVTHWDFGDGTSSYSDEDVVTHTYTAEGVYSVELRVTNAAGPGIKYLPDLITVGPAIVDDDTTDDDVADDDAADDDAADDDAADDDTAADDDFVDDDLSDDDNVSDDDADDDSTDDDTAADDDDDDDDSGSSCGS